MRILIGCLALIGLCVVVTIAGCMGLIGFGIASLPKTPAYVTREFIEHRYASDLKLIDAAARSGAFAGLAAAVSSDVLAVYHGDEDLLKRNEVMSKSFKLINGVGTGSIRTSTKTTTECLVYELQKGSAQYQVFLIDHGPPAGPAARPVL